MEEYLQHMKTLRSQMNDVEDQAAKVSVEEQTQITTIQTLEKDLASAKSEAKRLKEDAEQMMKAKGEICSQILEKQRKIASLESDSSTLAQTLELIQRERVSLSARLVEKSAYYTKVADDINSKLQQQQDWVNTHRISGEMGERVLMKQSIGQLKCTAKDFKTELLEMDIKTLEEEYKALLSDKAGEIEYLQSLRKQIKQLKDISLMVKCACGVEYKVAIV